MHKYFYFLFSLFLVIFTTNYLILKPMRLHTHYFLRLFLVLCLCIGAGTSLKAQSRVFEEDVVYLKNGSVLRGEILEHEVGKYLKIRLREGVDFSYKTEEIDKVSREASKYTKIKLRYHNGFMPVRFLERGQIFTQLAFSLAFNETQNQVLTNVSARLKVFKHLGTRVNPGLGTGFDFYEGGLIIPVFAELQGDFFKKQITPYYFLQGGYGIGAGGSRDHIIFRGGLMAHVGMGVHWYTDTKRSYYLGMGFRAQQTYQEFREYPPDFFCCGFPGGAVPDPPLVIGNRRYQKITLQFAYNF